MQQSNIYVRCSAVGCTYITGPHADVEIAQIAARLHEIAWMPQPGSEIFAKKHKCYFLNPRAIVSHAAESQDVYYCKYCKNEVCDCPQFDNEGNEI